MRKTSPLLVATTLMLGSLVFPPTSAGDLNVSWDPSTDATGYRIHYGPNPSQYDTSFDVGNATVTNLDSLGDCVMWHFAATAYNAAGESGYSEEVASWPRPVLAQATPNFAEQGRQLDVSISGTNFQGGAIVSFSDPAIAVNSINVSSCTELSVNLTIGNAAGIGPVVVTVAHPNGVSSQASALFAVEAETTAPVISDVVVSAVGSTTATIEWTTDETSNSQVLYRKLGQTEYQQTDVDESSVTLHSMLLQGLVPNSTYEFQVTSVDSAGNGASQTSGQTFTTADNTYSYVVLEAESGILSAPIQLLPGPDAFGGAGIEMVSGNGNPSNPDGVAAFSVHLPAAGEWFLWVRVYAPDQASDSWLSSVDGGSWSTLSAPSTGEWVWQAASSYVLADGLHDLELGGLDSGARADRILLTDDSTFVPTEQPVSDVTPPATVSQFAATPDDESNALTWTNPSDSDYTRTVIRYRTDGVYPQSAADGYPVLDSAGSPGGTGTHTHQGLTNGVTYYYSAFAVDAAGNAAPAAQIEATPAAAPSPPAPPTNVSVL